MTLFRTCILLTILTCLSQETPGQKVAPDQPDFIEAQIYGAYPLKRHASWIVYLHHGQTNRFLPIFIGQCEGNAIWRKLQEVDFPRPLTHDLFQNVLEAAGTRILSAQIDQMRPLDDRESGTYFAVLTLQQADGTRTEVDARPSDSIALAVRMKFPIYVARQIFEENSVEADLVPEKSAPDPLSQTPSKTRGFY
ncbi:MAG: bifunctional nuclease family protein [bacterium]|nr:bifunctional nuclease family protein [bacterium]